MSEPTFETVRVVHPRIPDSEHDVPKQSLAFKMRSGWVLAGQEPEEDQSKQKATVEEVKPKTSTSSKSEPKKEEK